MAGEDDDAGASRACVPTQATRKLETGHAGETHVGNDDVGPDATRAVEAV
jgi:hypothetical protein